MAPRMLEMDQEGRLGLNVGHDKADVEQVEDVEAVLDDEDVAVEAFVVRDGAVEDFAVDDATVDDITVCDALISAAVDDDAVVDEDNNDAAVEDAIME